MSCPLTGSVDASTSVAVVATDEDCIAIVEAAIPAPIGPLPSISDECGINDYYIGDLIFIGQEGLTILS